MPQLRPRFSAAEWVAMEELHPLPPGWQDMADSDFLAARRKLMAGVIRRGYESLR